MNFDMLEYYNMLREKDINIIYTGPLWADGIAGIGDTLKKCLEFDDLPLSTSQKVFSVFVEQMNNMLMYSADKTPFTDGENISNASKGIFVLGVKDKHYFIQSANLIASEKVPALRDRIDHINSLDKAGLREYFKQQLKAENTNPESKGGGLGFIEIARRANSKIEYRFDPVEEGLSFFSMYVTIG